MPLKCPCNPKASVVSHVSGVLLIFARLAVGIPTIGTGERRGSGAKTAEREKAGRLSVSSGLPLRPVSASRVTCSAMV